MIARHRAKQNSIYTKGKLNDNIIETRVEGRSIEIQVKSRKHREDPRRQIRVGWGWG